MHRGNNQNREVAVDWVNRELVDDVTGTNTFLLLPCFVAAVRNMYTVNKLVIDPISNVLKSVKVGRDVGQ